MCPSTPVRFQWWMGSETNQVDGYSSRLLMGSVSRRKDFIRLRIEQPGRYCHKYPESRLNRLCLIDDPGFCYLVSQRS
jgi:hypothetical protein